MNWPFACHNLLKFHYCCVEVRCHRNIVTMKVEGEVLKTDKKSCITMVLSHQMAICASVVYGAACTVVPYICWMNVVLTQEGAGKGSRCRLFVHRHLTVTHRLKGVM